MSHNIIPLPSPGYPQPPTPDSSNSRESDVFQFPGSGSSEQQQLQHQQLQQPGGPGYLQSLLRQEVGQQFPGLQENPFLQHSREQQAARFQYPPGLQQEPEKNGQEPEQERPRMHNGKKVSNINISIF